MCKLQELLGGGSEHFENLDSFEKASFVLGSDELWEDDFSSMLALVKDYRVDVWELRKARLYDENLSVPQSQCQHLSGELGDVGDGGRLRCLHGKVDNHFVYVYMWCWLRPVFWVRGLWPWCYGCHLSIINPRRAHAQRGLRYLVCVSVCVSVCLHLFSHYRH